MNGGRDGRREDGRGRAVSIDELLDQAVAAVSHMPTDSGVQEMARAQAAIARRPMSGGDLVGSEGAYEVGREMT